MSEIFDENKEDIYTSEKQANYCYVCDEFITNLHFCKDEMDLKVYDRFVVKHNDNLANAIISHRRKGVRDAIDEAFI